VGFLRCTVLDADTGDEHDIELSFEPAASVASLLAALPVSLRGRTVYAGSQRLDPGQTIGESGIVVGGVICVGAPVTDLRQLPDDVAGVLRVVAGPDAGRWTWVRSGAGAMVGRGDRADLLLSDPKASRLHAEVTTAGRPADPVATVRDLDSANGTTVGGIATTGVTTIPDNGGFEIGSSLIQWIPLDRVTAGWRRSPDGRIEFTRRFHSAPIPAPATIALPSALPESSRGMMMLAGSMGAPVLIGVVMWVATQSLLYLLMTLLAPLTGGVQQFVERKRRAGQAIEFNQEKERATGEIAVAVTTQEQIRRLNDPDEISLTLSALGALPRLWTKRLAGHDALTVRVGTRDEPAAVQFQGDRWRGLDRPSLRAVPVTVDLRTTGVLGVVGDRLMVEGLARWVLVQLATRRSPEDLWLVVLSRDDGAQLRWTRWLPHLDPGENGDFPARVGTRGRTVAARVEELRLLVESRLAAQQERTGGGFGQDVVVLLDGAHDLRKLTGMRTVLTRGPEVGVYAICLDDTDINECRGRVTVDADGRLEVVRSLTDDAEPARAETTTQDDAERVSRLLAPLRDRAHASAAEGSIPYPVRFLDLVGLQNPSPDDVLSVWNHHRGPSTRVPLGADARGNVYVDLALQGPHTMLAGATGAGKSILLQTLVVSLLLHNRPDELNLVLVDFKGGAAFLPFQDCPQVVGLIRSTGDTPADVFDEAAAQRVLASIRAEVARRERWLSRYGGEIDEYLKSRPAGAPPLPRLLMIFDEFARVLDSSPGFVKELVNVAGKGRSLGMHLLLATQSLQGKLTPEMKNNIELRISLRQNQPEESTEVLDVPDAAAIPGRLRGRGLILCTKDDPALPRTFQAGYLGDPPPTDQAPPVSVRIVDWPSVGDARPEQKQAPSTQPTDQDLLIGAITRAADRLQLPAPFRPLLPPLPARIELEDLDLTATDPIAADAIPFGLLDLPSQQSQLAAVLSLSGDDRLMIAGGPQSGRSTAVRTLIHSTVNRFAPTSVHLYVVEREPAGLSAYQDVPHCGGVFGPAEPDRLRRFVTWLGDETERRQAAQFSAAKDPATLLVLIDGWEIFHDPSDSTSVETSLVRILRQVIKAGPKVGVRVVVTCDRGPFMSKPGDLFNDRLVLFFPQQDVQRSALPSGSTVPVPIPGRAGEAATGRHVQIAEPAESTQQLVARLANVAPDPALRWFPSLPRQIGLAEVAGVRPADASADWIPLGVGGPEVGPVGVDLFAGPQMLLISGPAGSGRSTAAATVVTGLGALGIGSVVLCPPRSPLAAQLAGRPGVSVLVGPTFSDEVIRQAAAALVSAGMPRVVIVADDCEQLTVLATTKNFDEMPTLLVEATTPEQLGRMGLVLCGNAMALLDGPRRSLTAVTRHVLDEGTRLLLTPTAPATAREHRVTLEVDQFVFGPAGRGYLARGREQLLVQLATPNTQAGLHSSRIGTI
jgi:S-DNA-T family DNA segregation ATPase FtsK/SpoIIIE